jgi:hypothetical protein
MDLQLDSPPFDLLYTNIKARANNNASKPSSGPRQGPATHGLDVIIIFGFKDFLVNFIFGGEHFSINFVLTVASEDDQICPHRSSINKRDGNKVGRWSNRYTVLLPQRWNQR